MDNRNKLYFSRLKLWLSASLTLTVLCLFVLGQNSTAKRSPSTTNDMQSYLMDLSQSQIKLILTQEGLLAMKHPMHHVGVKKFSGKIFYSPQDETKVSITLEAETKSFENIDPDMGDFERKGFQDILHHKVLESDQYPKIIFKSVSVSEVKSNEDHRSFTLSGDLTLHGTTKRIAFPVNAMVDKDVLR